MIDCERYAYLSDEFQLSENEIDDTSELPEPLLDSGLCIECPLNFVCLPEEINYLKHKIPETKRLYPGRPEGGVLYVTGFGGKISKDGESLCVWIPQQETVYIPLKDVEDVCVIGNVQMTTQAMYQIIEKGGSICYLGASGQLNAITTPISVKAVKMKQLQYKLFQDETIRTELTKAIVKAKINNQRTILRRNSKISSKRALAIMMRTSKQVGGNHLQDVLRGMEGYCAKLYWNSFDHMFSDREQWTVNGRSTQPPKDPVNSLLSYGYTLLVRDFLAAVSLSGLDPTCGFFHSLRDNKPSLALDLMEPFRPIIVDSIVLRLVNENMVHIDDFLVHEDGAVLIKPSARKKLIAMYERRVDELITHPVFGYRLSYRRLFALEAKLLGKYLTGEIAEYAPFQVR